MCLPIDSWFCMSSTVNDDCHQPAPANKQQGPTTQLPAQHNGGGHYNGNGYPVHHAPAAAAEADRKASNDVRRRPAPTHAVPAGVQEKADGTLKQQPTAARNGMVAAADGARGVAAHTTTTTTSLPTERTPPPPRISTAATTRLPRLLPITEGISAIHGC